MLSNLAPIALFVYNRPLHTQKVLEALAKNPEAKDSTLYVFWDGPKLIGSGNETSTQLQNTIDCCTKNFKEVIIFKQNENQGLAKSIIHGISEVLKNHDKIIVLEDDIVVSTGFLNYMNQGLNSYENNNTVATIQGYQFPIKFNSKNQTFFDYSVGCWGWATWKDRWTWFEPNGKSLWETIENKNNWKTFDLQNTYPFKELLTNQILGKNDSWAIRWYASLFIKNKLNLYPIKSLTVNIGNDGSGFHKDTNDTSFFPLVDRIELIFKEPKLDQKEVTQVIKYRKKVLQKRKIKNLLIKLKKNVFKVNSNKVG